MSGLNNLQEALRIWVTIERNPGTEEVTTKEVAPGVEVTEVMAYPEATSERFSDLHFMRVVPTESFPSEDVFVKTVKDALGEGEFSDINGIRLSGGLSYIDLGGWLGSQELGLMLIGAMDLVGLGTAIIPATLGVTGADGDNLAGMGMVMMAPWAGWMKSEGMTRAEHLAWAKERALEILDSGDIQSAFTSMASDLRKHPELSDHPGMELGMMELMGGFLNTPQKMRDHITGYN